MRAGRRSHGLACGVALLALVACGASGDGRTFVGSCRGDGPAVVLEAGLGNLGSELNSIAYDLGAGARVCTYNRAGLGGSSPPATTPRTLDDLVADLGGFLAQEGVRGPYVLVGHSLGGSIVLRYAQQHPDDVAGVVAMNPVPPYTAWIARVRGVEGAAELEKEEAYYAGANAESVDLRGTDLILSRPVPDAVPYVVMFAEDCPGDFCDRLRPAQRAAAEELARAGRGGRFVEVPGSGHDIFLSSHSGDIVREIRALLPRH